MRYCLAGDPFYLLPLLTSTSSFLRPEPTPYSVHPTLLPITPIQHTRVKPRPLPSRDVVSSRNPHLPFAGPLLLCSTPNCLTPTLYTPPATTTPAPHHILQTRGGIFASRTSSRPFPFPSLPPRIWTCPGLRALCICTMTKKKPFIFILVGPQYSLGRGDVKRVCSL